VLWRELISCTASTWGLSMASTSSTTWRASIGLPSDGDAEHFSEVTVFYRQLARIIPDFPPRVNGAGLCPARAKVVRPGSSVALDLLAQHAEEPAEVLVRQGVSSETKGLGQRRGQQLTKWEPSAPVPLTEGSQQPSPSRLGYQTDRGC
jgi:hypothetical protein